METLRSRRETHDIQFAAVDALHKTYLKNFTDDPEAQKKAESVRAIAEEFFEEQVANTELFRSEKHGVSFLHSAVGVGELAKKLYERHTGTVLALGAEESTGKSHDEFIFPSFFQPQNPNALFVFFEQGLNQLITHLPSALEDIQQGKEPPRYAVHFIFTPMRDIGHITPEFVEKLKDGKSFNVFGELYADLVKQRASSEGIIALRGISMGAPLALKTAEQLLHEGVVTQDTENKTLSRLVVRIDTPPSQNDTQSFERAKQVQLGFAVDGLRGLVSDPMARASGKPWGGTLVKNLLPILEKKGIREEMSPEDVALKKEAITLTLQDFYNGMPVPADVKVTEVVGTSDTTMFMPFSRAKREIKEKVAEQSAEFDGSLGEKIISDNPQRRTFAADMGHVIPNITDTAMRRLDRVAKALQSLKNE